MPEPMQSDVPMIREQTERPERSEPVDTVEAVRALGTYHEGLRNRSETALNSLKSLRSAAEEMEGLFTEFGEIARQLHLNKRELTEIKTAYASSPQTERGAARQALVLAGFAAAPAEPA